MTAVNVEDDARSSIDSVRSESKNVTKIMQQNASRVWRANERVLRGMLSAIKLEVELGQQLLQYRLTGIEHATQEPKLENAGHKIIDHQLHEVEHLMSGMQKISEELKQIFSEATKLLFDGTDAEAKHQVEEIIEAANPKTARQPKSDRHATE
jgi:hypothetical protein